MKEMILFILLHILQFLYSRDAIRERGLIMKTNSTINNQYSGTTMKFDLRTKIVSSFCYCHDRKYRYQD